MKGSNVLSQNTAVNQIWVSGTCNPRQHKVPRCQSLLSLSQISSFGTENYGGQKTQSLFPLIPMKIFWIRVVFFISINFHISFYANRRTPTDEANIAYRYSLLLLWTPKFLICPECINEKLIRGKCLMKIFRGN